MPPGTYTYTVTAVFGGFTASASSAPITVAALTTPTITTTPSSPSANSTPSFAFSGGGSGTYECQIDGGAFIACTSPNSYGFLTDGSHTFKVHSTQGASTGPDATYTWVIGTAVPTITVNPVSPSASSAASFAFTHAPSVGYTYECRLDDVNYRPCTSAAAYSGLAADNDSHTFRVRALTTDGAITPPASYTWTIDMAAPTLTATPSLFSADPAPSFSFSHRQAAYTFECQLDGGGFSACTSAESYAALSDGSHTFAVQGVDAAGTATNSTVYSWTIDTGAPTITIRPTDPSTSRAPSFSFSHVVAGYTFECSLDAGSYSPCTSPQAYSSLADGSHTFRVRGVSTDLGSTTVATYTWTIEATPPTAQIALLPTPVGASLTGSTIFYKGNAPGSFRLTDAVSDSGAGPASAAFGDIATIGWTHAAETATTGTGSPPTITYTSNVFSWTANPSNPVGYTVLSRDVAGNDPSRR